MTRLCKCCGEPIPENRKTIAIYCSNLCKRRVINLRERRRNRPICKICGNPVPYTGGSYTLCSDICRDIAVQRGRAEYNAKSNKKRTKLMAIAKIALETFPELKEYLDARN